MGMLGDKKGDSYWQAFKWPLICEAFGNKQTHCKLLRDIGNKQAHCMHIVRFTLATSWHIGWIQTRS